jgi:FkbM family methyltransferase
MTYKLFEIVAARMSLADVRTVFDCGARDCETSEALSASFPLATVHAFECNPATLPKCRAVAKRHPMIVLREAAVRDLDGPTAFFAIDQTRTRTTHPDGNPGASSLFEATGDYPYESYVQTKVVVDGCRLDTYCRSQEIQSVDVAWMDLQGAELLALRGMGKYLPRFLWTEVSYRAIYQGQVLYPELRAWLSVRGYIEIVAPDTSWSDWQGDACFYRAPNAT